MVCRKSLNLWCRAAGLSLLLTVDAASASAALGEGVSRPAANAASAPKASVLKSQNSNSGAVAAPNSAPYAVSEVTSENGTTVREFSRPDGVVFAVAWLCNAQCRTPKFGG